MNFRTSTRTLALVGLVATGPLVAPAAHAVSSGSDAASGLSVDVTGFDGPALVGTVRCDPVDRVTLTGSVVQDLGELGVSGWIGTNVLDCTGASVPFRLPITGNGVLVPGPVGYDLDAYTDRGIQVEATGEVAQRGRADLGYTPVTSGPLTIVIDPVAGKASSGPVVTGTITCDQPQWMDLRLSGRQVAGRYHLPIEIVGGVEPHVRCDGVMPFALPITSPRGELRSYAATISIMAQPAGAGVDDPLPEPSTTTGQVALRSRTPEPDFTPEPDPAAPVVVGAVRRVGETFEVDLTNTCSSGTIAPFRVEVRLTSLRIGGRWWNPGEVGRETDWNLFTCDGTARDKVVQVPATFEADEVAVVVRGAIDSPESDENTSYTTGAVVEVSTK